MTGQRFDDLTKALGRSTSRRSVLKALAATALGGLLTRADRRSADAAARPGLRAAARSLLARLALLRRERHLFRRRRFHLLQALQHHLHQQRALLRHERLP